jgi:hypothetical protein
LGFGARQGFAHHSGKLSILAGSERHEVDSNTFLFSSAGRALHAMKDRPVSTSPFYDTHSHLWSVVLTMVNFEIGLWACSYRVDEQSWNKSIGLDLLFRKPRSARCLTLGRPECPWRFRTPTITDCEIIPHGNCTNHELLKTYGTYRTPNTATRTLSTLLWNELNRWKERWDSKRSKIQR